MAGLNEPPIETTVVIDRGPDVKHYLSKPCLICRVKTRVQVSPIKLARWREGEFVQDVWPSATADQRELLVTGTHSECWEKMFPEEGEDEEQ